ncbi:hypothetical protein MRS44_018640 [Fusarium solani]|uniref:uncharacterized protein n=1 Tax=Fusarium solani TaxID=169388 RepID=UPI0032C47EBE|nr:hypothetical protein MRS44_018640 [Fusarium solani]
MPASRFSLVIRPVLRSPCSPQALVIEACFVPCVTADAGDDFSNPLFTDLAPLLALFGERVTMQLMSKAMGWADNVILAVGPLGKITAIVGAIGIGGPSWLRAIIGRARESRAVPVPATVSLAYRHVAFIPQPAFTSPSCSCTGNVEIIELLLAPGATAERQCYAGRSPMWWSRRAGNVLQEGF